MAYDNKLTSREENYSEWYNELVEKAGLAEKSDVRGCMVIKPYGYAIWENIQTILDSMFKNTGHQNAYFPLLIPKSYLSMEASHVDGFAKECAVVTHHRLRASADGWVEVDPDAKLEEELVIRPTSETIIWKTFKNRVTSYRDLPLLINQRANVVRWEMRTRMFLRTTEFLRQEGHTAHATAEEARDEAIQMLEVYQDVLENYLAISGVGGVKSETERFAGADETLTIEGMMQDGKALQSCTSHFLGQNFAKAFDVKFMNKENTEEFVWATSRGMTTRIMGALIMSHGDDAGLVLPPLVAPLHVIIVPIFKSPEELEALQEYLTPLTEWLDGSVLTIDSQFLSYDTPITRKIDDDETKTAGRKFSERELKGVPVRVVVGARDSEKGVVEVMRRDTGDKKVVAIAEAAAIIHETLIDIQDALYQKNKDMREANTRSVDSREAFEEAVEQGFVLAHRDGTAESEAAIKEKTGATIRCLPFNQEHEEGVCVLTGKPSMRRVLFAKAY